MPVYQVDVQMNAGGIYVTNVWHVLAGSISEANEMGNNIAVVSAALIPPTMSVNHYRVSTPAEGDGVYYSNPVNIPGQRTTGGEPLPLFNRFRIDFGVGPRRPLRKFMLLVTETDVTAGQLNSAAITFVETNFITPLLESGDEIALCAPDGTHVIGASTAQQVGMRQLRRASKRKTPVIG